MSSDENTSTVRVKMRPMLSDMPPRIKQMIAERTDVKSRYSLRKVSTHFRDAVDKSPYNFGSLCITKKSNFVKLTLCGNIEIEYQKHGENGCVIKMRDTTDKIIEREDFMQRAFDDLGIILKNPKVFLMSFGLYEFEPRGEGVEQLLANLATFRHQLSIRELIVKWEGGQDKVVEFLNHVTPRTLETLHINNSRAYCGISVDRIADTEQWRHLKEVIGGNAEKVPIDKILHLEYFQPSSFKLTEQNIAEIVQWVREHRDISMKYRFFSIRSRDIVKNWQNAVSQFQPSRKRIRIPGTERYLEINLKRYGVTFKTTGGSPRGSHFTDADYDEDNDDILVFESLSDDSMEYNREDFDDHDHPGFIDIDSSSDSEDSDERDYGAINRIPIDSDEPAEYDASDESNASVDED